MLNYEKKRIKQLKDYNNKLKKDYEILYYVRFSTIVTCDRGDDTDLGCNVQWIINRYFTIHDIYRVKITNLFKEFDNYIKTNPYNLYIIEKINNKIELLIALSFKEVKIPEICIENYQLEQEFKSLKENYKDYLIDHNTTYCKQVEIIKSLFDEFFNICCCKKLKSRKISNTDNEYQKLRKINEEICNRIEAFN